VSDFVLVFGAVNGFIYMLLIALRLEKEGRSMFWAFTPFAIFMLRLRDWLILGVIAGFDLAILHMAVRAGWLE
jgi:hypothetical protein